MTKRKYYPKYNDKLYIRSYWRGQNYTYYYRSSSVPFTGLCGTSPIMYRPIKTTNERRQTYGFIADDISGGFDAEGKVIKIRKKRKNLPDSWDEIRRNYQRSWKKQRKTQWK